MNVQVSHGPSRNGSVGIVTRLPWFDSRQRQEVFLVQIGQTGIGAWPITCSLSPEIKRRGLEADHSHSNAEIKNEWRCISTTPYGFMPCVETTYRFLLRNYIGRCEFDSGLFQIKQLGGVCGTHCVTRCSDTEIVVVLAYGTAQSDMRLPSASEGHVASIFMVNLRGGLKWFFFERPVALRTKRTVPLPRAPQSLNCHHFRLFKSPLGSSPADEFRPHSK